MPAACTAPRRAATRCPRSLATPHPHPLPHSPHAQTEASVDLPESGDVDMFDMKVGGSFSGQGYYGNQGFTGSYTSGYSS
jgi:hypothetical protein